MGRWMLAHNTGKWLVRCRWLIAYVDDSLVMFLVTYVVWMAVGCLDGLVV